MANLNKAIIIGKVANIKEAKRTQAGHMMINFSVAVNKKRKEQFETTWFSCLLFNKSAEVFQKYYKKGDTIYCEGEVSARAYQAKDGSLKAELSLFVNEFHKLESAKTDVPRVESIPDNFGNQLNTFSDTFTEDDIPF